MALAALAALLTPPDTAPGLRAVRLTRLDERAALRLVTSEDVAAGEVRREGEEVVVRLAAGAPAELALPAARSPITGLRLEHEGGRTVLHVGVPPEVPFEVTHEPGLLTILFGEAPAAELRGTATDELYARLFPTGALERVEKEPEAKPEAETSDGLPFGPATLRPYLSASWVDADVAAFDSPRPVRTRYLQLTPGLQATLPLLAARLTAGYEPRLRFFSDVATVKRTSHLAGAMLETPLGTRGLLRLRYHFTHATLETGLVDPGREYFFDLAPFTQHEASGLVRVEIGSRLFLEGEGGFAAARFERPTTGAFDHDTRTARAGLGYDLGSELRAVLSYSYERIPPSPDRALVESTAHSLVGTLSGPLGALVDGTLSVGLRDQKNPLATGASASYRGLTLGASLRRELTRSTSLELQANRASEPSAFETNAYYVTSSAGLTLSLPAPLGTSARASLSFLRNDYPNAAQALGQPRRDDILGWAVGLGRQLGWRTFVRADYRRERRNSNLPGFDVTTDGFVVQLGVGLFGSGARP